MHLRMCTKFLTKVILSNLDTIIISLNVPWFVPCRCPSLEFDSNGVVSRHAWLEQHLIVRDERLGQVELLCRGDKHKDVCTLQFIWIRSTASLCLFHTVSWTWTYQRRKRSTVPSRGPVTKISEPQALHDSKCLTDCTPNASQICRLDVEEWAYTESRFVTIPKDLFWFLLLKLLFNYVMI